MIVFCVYTPHSPLLLPTIGRAHAPLFSPTLEAFATLRKQFLAQKVETLVVISSSHKQFADAFSIDLSDPYQVDLSEFGDLGTRTTYRPDLQLIDQLQREVRGKDIALSLNSEKHLAYASAVPAVLLDPTGGKKLVSLSTSGLERKLHVTFGNHLRECLERLPTRFGVIASGDLSHALSEKAPLGRREEGILFDKIVQQAVTAGLLSPLLRLTKNEIERAGECGLQPLLVLFGLLDQMSMHPHVLSYQAPFGVGLLTAEFQLSL